MAEKELDLDAKQKSGGKKRLLLMIAGALVLIGVSVGATLMLVGGSATDEAAAKAPPEPQYLPLESLVVNFGQPGPARYLQVDMEVMAHNGDVLAAIERHMPVLRNDILMLLAGQQYETIRTREGKEQLRAALVDAINRVLSEQAEIPDGEGIQAIYFTSFVMQ